MQLLLHPMLKQKSQHHMENSQLLELFSLRSRLRGLGTYDGEADFEGILKSKMQDEYEIEFLL